MSLSLRSTRQGSVRGRKAPERKATVSDTSVDHDALADAPGDLWRQYLDDPTVQVNCRHHLNRCFNLEAHSNDLY